MGFHKQCGPLMAADIDLDPSVQVPQHMRNDFKTTTQIVPPFDLSDIRSVTGAAGDSALY
jgi:hypothetical protein